MIINGNGYVMMCIINCPTTRFMHMKYIWDATWTMHRMLSHTVDLLIHPDPALLPDNLYEIYSMWKEGLDIKWYDYCIVIAFNITSVDIMLF